MGNVKLFIEGFLVGFGKIMPGVSGSVLAICFGLYERIVASLSSLKELKKNAKFMAIMGVSIFIAIVLGSNVIKYLLVNHYTKTLLFFIGMVIPGVFPIIKNVKNSDLTPPRVFLCTFVFAFLLILNTVGFSSNEVGVESYLHEFISLVLCGLVDAASTIIPGISGTALLMILGYYERIITALANLLIFADLARSILVLVPFFLGMGIGVVLTAKLITYLFRSHRAFTYMLITVFALFSILGLFMNVLHVASGVELLASSIFLVIGFASTVLLNKLFGVEE